MNFKDIKDGADLDAWAKEWAQSPEIYTRYIENCIKRVDATLLAEDDSQVEFNCNLGELIMQPDGRRAPAYLLRFGDQTYALPYDPETFKYTDARFVDPEIPELGPANKLQ